MSRMRGLETRIGLAAASTLLLLGAGCRVEHHLKGGNDDVKIATPFGGMNVKTDDATVQQNVGLAMYPGAVLDRKHGKGKGDDDQNNGAELPDERRAGQGHGVLPEGYGSLWRGHPVQG